MDDEAAYGGVFAFDFYEVLRVADGDLLPVGTLVAVLGRSRDEEGREWYAVTESEGAGPVMPRDWLVSTGRRLKREDFYDGSTVRVTALGQTVDEQ